MNVIKTGRFIADLRKEKNITQEELAEKLYVTDRAVSKWERGISLPDAGKMIDLCSILGISVNELLIGERVDMKDNEKKTEELLVEMAKEEEKMNKRLFRNMWVMVISCFLFYVAIILIASFTLGESTELGIIVTCSTILLCFVAFYAFKIEVDTGYYECRKCHHRYQANSYFKLLIMPHMGTTRYVKCPECNKWSWHKKVMSKEKAE